MLRKFLFFSILFLIQTTLHATFSIVAIDPETGEIGSAGASCIDSPACGGCGGVIIISDIIPGVGACNAQATVCIPNFNLQVVMGELDNGASPFEAWEEVNINDDCSFGTNEDRQYGIVGYEAGMVASHGFSGMNTTAYSNHIVGENYSIQGNILLGPEILEEMEAGFLNATGSLADKLMAAMQGANVAGADTRCLEEGTSSQSAYLRVAQPEDEAGDFYLELNVPQTPFGDEPIEALQALYDEWLCEQMPPIVSDLTVSVCDNETYIYSGTTLSPGTVTDFTFVAVNGCDSTLSVTVEALPIFSSSDTLSISEGESVIYADSELMAGTTTDLNFLASNGCDSIVSVTVQATPTGIEDAYSSLMVYPNPTNNHINIVHSEVLPFSYELINIHGQVCLSGSQDGRSNRIDMSQMPLGVYFVKFYLGEEIRVKKVLKR